MMREARIRRVEIALSWGVAPFLIRLKI